MSGCDNRNSPIVGSSVKPCTPWPVVYTSMVLEPYRMYPAATCFRPTCRQSASPGSLLGPVTRLWIEKIVPIDTLTSMLVEPSSGSYMITYLPRRDVLGQSIGSSSSSDATTHTRPVCCTPLRTVPRAHRSHFGCRMAVMIVRPHADHGLARPQLAEPRIRRGGGRAVMPHLEQLHAADPPGEVTFHRQPGVGLKQQARGAERHPQHYAVFVHVERQRHPDAVRTQHLEHYAVHLDPVAGPRRVPARSRPPYRRE